MNAAENKKKKSFSFKKDTVYTWGNGNFGQLGHGQESSKPIPKKIEELEAFEIVSIKANKYMSAALTAEGKLFTWGSSKGGAIGHNSQGANVTIPRLIESLAHEKIVSISCGVSHMAAVTDDGRLFGLLKRYTWGNPEHGKLGTPRIVEKQSMKHYNTHTNLDSTFFHPELVKTELIGKIKEVSCGYQHTVKI